MNITITNNTIATILIGDMGIYVAALQQLDITSLFSLYEIRSSNDLKDLCVAGSFSLIYNSEALTSDMLDIFFDYMSDYGLSLVLGDTNNIYGDGPYTLSFEQFDALQTSISGGGSFGTSIPYKFGEDLPQGIPVYYDVVNDSIRRVGTQLGNKSSHARAYFQSIDMLDSNRFVVAYADVNNGNRGTVRVGQINVDNSITWGTPIVFYSSHVYYLDVCVIDTNKFVIAFRDSSYHGQVIVGQVHHNVEILFGSTVTFNSANTAYISCCKSSTNNFVVCYTNGGASSHGTAIAASVSALIPIFGTAVEYYTSSAYYNTCWGCGIDHKFSVAYRGVGSRVNVCTVFDTIIVVGTSTQWYVGNCYNPSMRNIDTEKMVISYRDTSDGNKCKMVAFSISGTSPTFGNIVTANNVPSYYSAVCQQGTDGFICMYTTDTGLYAGSFKRGSVSGVTIALASGECFINNRIYYMDVIGVTSTKYVSVWYDTINTASYACVIDGNVNTIPKFLGITTESGSVGETGYVDLIGSVSTVLPGLDTGEIYYIQCSGIINKNISNYKAGKAVASNKLLIAVEGYFN